MYQPNVCESITEVSVMGCPKNTGRGDYGDDFLWIYRMKFIKARQNGWAWESLVCRDEFQNVIEQTCTTGVGKGQKGIMIMDVLKKLSWVV